MTDQLETDLRDLLADRAAEVTVDPVAGERLIAQPARRRRRRARPPSSRSAVVATGVAGGRPLPAAACFAVLAAALAVE